MALFAFIDPEFGSAELKQQIEISADEMADMAARYRTLLADDSRIVELFKQPAFNPIPIELQVAVLFGMQRGLFDPIDVKKVVVAAQSMKDFFVTRKDALLTEIRTKAALDKDLEAKLQAACDEWKGTFNA